jgi:hypothetical protein
MAKRVRRVKAKVSKKVHVKSHIRKFPKKK